MRPAELAGPEVGKFQMWKHALAACEAYYQQRYECLIDLHATCLSDVTGKVAGRDIAADVHVTPEDIVDFE